jgi:ComF family protein
MRLFIDRLFQFLLPSQCHCCQRFLEESERGLCSDCFSRIRWIEPPFCSVCGSPFVSKEAGIHPCGECAKGKKHFTTARALGAYEGPLQEAIHRWKYEGKVTLTFLFGRWLAEGVKRYWNPSPFELLIPVPLHKQRLRQRGFNQALLLATQLSLLTGVPFRKSALKKLRPTLPQVDLSGLERRKSVKGSFNVAKGEEVRGKCVLLIDDVYTTGATVNECAKVLMAAGSERVDVLTLARALKHP